MVRKKLYMFGAEGVGKTSLLAQSCDRHLAANVPETSRPSSIPASSAEQVEVIAQPLPDCHVLSDIPRALDSAVLEYDRQGGLYLLAEAPPWFLALWPEHLSDDGAFTVSAAPSLERFLVDARRCWNGGGRLDSGTWLERDSRGGENLLHATALTVQNRPILLLEKLGHPFCEQRRMLQDAHQKLENAAAKRTSELASANQLLQVQRAELLKMSRRLLNIQEVERQRIARHLHDDMGQLLTSLILRLEMGIGQPAEAGQNALIEGRSLASEVLERIRQMSLDLRPSVLDDLGLLAALEWHFRRLEQRCGMVVRFGCEGITERPPAAIETAGYRIVQEALTNVARHSGVRDATVELRQSQGVLHLRVEDHGAGFELPSVAHPMDSNGLRDMRHRAELLGGGFQVRSAKGRGTTVMVRLPLA